MKINLPYSIYKKTMPNVRLQYDLPDEIKESGCAPIALANIIKYLAKHSCVRIMPPQGHSSEQYSDMKLVETLAVYMDTDRNGTNNSDAIKGLEMTLSNLPRTGSD